MGWLSICSVFLQSNSNLLNFEVREPGARRWSSGTVVVTLLACGAKGPDSIPSLATLVISCFQVIIWLTYRWRDVNPQSRGGGGGNLP